jgi:hypothetical protein
MQNDLSNFTVDEISLESKTEKVILYKSEA